MSKYTIKGHLSAELIRNHTECLSGVTVKIYRLPPVDGNDAVLIPKNSFESLSQKEVIAKEDFILGESIADADGNYCVHLSDAYEGGIIAIDVKIDQVPFQKDSTEKGPQVTLRKFPPIWRKKEDEWCCHFNCCIPFEFWSGIRLQCDAWLIIGHVKTSCEAQKPLGQVSVTAYDFDWDKDDELGVAITDEAGFFRIDYSSKDYTRTMLSPLINIETPISLLSGPGLYFRIKDKEGQLLHKENRDMGCGEGRKNAHHCFYEDIFVDMDMLGNKIAADED